MTLLADLRHAAVHESGHALVAGLLGVRGSIVIRASNFGVEGAFRFADTRAITQATAERIAVAGAVATALYENPGIDLEQLIARLNQTSGGLSGPDLALCRGRISAAAVADVLASVRGNWGQVLQLAERECSALGVSFP